MGLLPGSERGAVAEFSMEASLLIPITPMFDEESLASPEQPLLPVGYSDLLA